MLEVGLHYQKRWSVDRIARFTFRLHRRRLRAQEVAARARWTTRHAQGVAYRIGPSGDPHIGFAEVMAAAETRRANQRLLDRVRAQLSRRLSRSNEQAAVNEPCWICGKPATVWSYVDRDHRVRVTDGYATCAEHFAAESPKEVAETRAS
ncbi:MAG: hypothetical protein ACXWWU_06255 [Candidatus Limnocylindria bacterium]